MGKGWVFYVLFLMEIIFTFWKEDPVNQVPIYLGFLWALCLNPLACFKLKPTLKLESFQNYFSHSRDSGYEADQRLLQWGSKLGRNVVQLESETHTRDSVICTTSTVFSRSMSLHASASPEAQFWMSSISDVMIWKYGRKLDYVFQLDEGSQQCDTRNFVFCVLAL